MNTQRGVAAVGRTNYVCASCRAKLASRPAAQGSQRRHVHQSTERKLAEAAERWNVKAKREADGQAPTMLKFLEDRGYVNQIAGERSKTEEIMRKERIGVYVGIDPTAPSMHVGHLVPFMALFWMYKHGYKAYSLLGGATAQVGDPTGRITSRHLSNPSRKENIARMHLQLKTIWANVDKHLTKRMGMKDEYARRRGIVNNSVWLHKLSITEFLRKLGNYSRVGTMLSRDTAKHKMEHGDGLSFSEFTYPLLQGWDWWELNKQLGVRLQIGGSDQMGNIMAGKEALMSIAREDQFEHNGTSLEDASPIGFTTPLLTTAAGTKFGKSAGNAIWLDPEMTSIFDQYQFFVRTHDADLERYLRLFTFLPEDKIVEIMEENSRDPGKRIAGKALGEQVCLALHGEELTRKAVDESEAVFGKTSVRSGVPRDGQGPVDGQVTHSASNPLLNSQAPQTNSATEFERSITLPVSRVTSQTYPALLKYAGMVESRKAGANMIKAGGVYIGSTSAGQAMRENYSFSKIIQGRRVQDVEKHLLDDGSALILRIGKWKVKFITIVSDKEWEAGVQKGEAELRDRERTGEATTNTLTLKYAQWAKTERLITADAAQWAEEQARQRVRSENLKRLDKATKAELRLDFVD